MRYSLSLFSIVFLLISFSCNNVKSEYYLAKVNDEFLYFDDVIYNIPKSIKDTNLFVEMYVEKWVREKVLLNQALINIDEDSKEVVRKIEDQYNSGEIDYLDGISVTFDDWRFNVRTSNTQPLLRLNLEAKNMGLVQEKVDELKALIGGKLADH